MYAATKNQNNTKPNIPTKVNNSPSSSGFTFFGIPLNNLIGGVGRKEDTNPAPIEAQRKTAILSHKNDRVQKGNIQSNLPYISAKPEEIINMRPPPPAPDLQGGFMPILPSDGGFQPITDPNLTTLKPVTTTKRVSVQNPVSSTTPSQHILPKQNDKLQQQMPVNVNKDNDVSMITSTQGSLENVSTLSNQLLENDQTLNKTTLKRTTFLQETHYSRTINKTTGPVSEIASLAPKTITWLNETTTPEAKKDISRSSKSSIDLSTSTSGQMFKPNVTEVVTLPSNMPKNGSINKNNIDTSPQRSMEHKPTLLIPGGQQPPFKTGGRSSITKVQSPHTPENTPSHSFGNQKDSTKGPPYQSARGLGYIPDPQPHREEKAQEGILYADKGNNDWYFANYNNTNLEPFTAKITNSGQQHKLNCIVLITHCFVAYLKNID